MPKKISIIILGNNHLDFKLFPIMREWFTKLNRKAIPTAFLEEQIGAIDLNHVIAVKKKSSLIKELVKTVSFNYLSEFYNHDDLTDPYLNEKDKKAIITKIEPHMASINQLLQSSGLPPFSSTAFVDKLLKQNLSFESLKFYKFLQQSNIFYSNIEPTLEKYHDKYEEFAKFEDITKIENSRIQIMLANTLKACELFQNGGVIFVFVGAAHAHRLAAHILFSIQNNPQLSALIEIHTFELYTHLAVEELCDLLRSEMILGTDAPEILSCYKKLPLKKIKLTEKQNSFSELDILIQTLINNWTFKHDSIASSSMFSKKPTSHELLLIEIGEYCKENPKATSQDFLEIVSSKNYSRALRCVCSWGNAKLVQTLLKYADVLPFDFSATCSKGNTPRMLFQNSNADKDLKIEISNLLIEHELNQAIESIPDFKLSPHEQLVEELNNYIQKNPSKVSKNFLKIVDEDKNYSRGLRSACSWGDAELVQILLKYADVLSFDLSEKCSKGYTPRMWFDNSKANMALKTKISDLLIDRELEQAINFLDL